MLATLGELPRPPGWAYEFKWDGVRAIIDLHDGDLRVLSRNDRDVAASYPELAALLERFAGRPVVLDGEIVALDPAGRPSFSLLQQRMHVRAPTATLLSRVPVQLYVFDLLYLDAASLLDEAYTQRRRRLDALGLDDEVVKTPPYWADDAGADLMQAAEQQGLEGVVAKRLTSRYEPGVRSRSWIKTPRNTTTEVVICGWKPGEGRRAGMIGSLVLGQYNPAGQLTFVGGVGTGFTQQMLAALAHRLRALHRATSPFDVAPPREHVRDVHWVQPRLVADIAYRTRTPDNRLRHPSYRGLRPDRDPREARVAAP